MHTPKTDFVRVCLTHADEAMSRAKSRRGLHLAAGVFAATLFSAGIATAQAPVPSNPTGAAQQVLAAPQNPAATASAGAVTIDTPLEQMIAIPAAKAIIDKDVPGLTTHPMFDQFKKMSLREVQPYTQGQLSDEALKQVSVDLTTIKLNATGVNSETPATPK